MPKHKRHHAKIKEQVNDTGKYTSTATSHRNRLFHNVKNANAGVTQNVSVKVQVEKEDDCLSSCFGALGACFGKGAKGAAS